MRLRLPPYIIPEPLEIVRIDGPVKYPYSQDVLHVGIGSLAEFEKWRLISSHICRRSFATNHFNKMTNKQIMAVTGHKTEKSLLTYIGKTDSEHISDFLNLWENSDTSNRKMKKA